MSIQTINRLFKSIIITLGLSVAFCLIILVPQISQFLGEEVEVVWIQWLIYLTGIPVVVILFALWQLSTSLLKETIFSERNQSHLIKITYAGIIESAIYALAIVIGLFKLQGNYPYLFICFFFFFLGLIIAVVASLMSYIIKLGSQLKNENDLTI